MMDVENSRVIGKNAEKDYFFFKCTMLDRWGISGERTKQGCWIVSTVFGVDIAEFLDLELGKFAYGVMDDFGNLVKVEA